MTDDRARSVDEILGDYFEPARRREHAPADLWARVKTRIDPDAATSRRFAPGRRVATRLAIAVAVAIVLAAGFALAPSRQGDEPSNAMALAILNRAHAAFVIDPSDRPETVAAQTRTERAVYDPGDPQGVPIVQEIEMSHVWWSGPERWRAETTIDYRRDGETATPEPGWLTGGVTVSDGERVWVFSDIAPGIDPVTGERAGPRVTVSAREAEGHVPLDLPFAMVFPAASSVLGDGQGMEALLRDLEECFVAEFAGEDIVAERETDVVRLRPRHVGKVEPGPIAADSCHAALAHEPTARGGRIAEQTLTLWIDREHHVVLRFEQVVDLSHGDEPSRSVTRSEVVEVAFDVEIAPERFSIPTSGYPRVSEPHS